MRRAISVVTCLVSFLFAAAHTSRAHETTSEFSVQASAAIQETPARITLHWPRDLAAEAKSYSVYRKAPGATAWAKVAVLPANATQYVDNNVVVGTGYEYQIVKATPHYNGYGYVDAGIDLPLTETRGRLLLVVDKTHARELAPELSRLEQDLVGDGWTVTRLDVARNDSVVSVKNRIKAEYNADPAGTKAVFLFGHVPVPYSGDIVPDGHVPDHQGAWPADGYYGDMTGAWTDVSVKDVSAADARNRNVPGDGKFDQSSFPAPITLMVGRVDLANMPGRLSYGGAATFPDETQLLRNYLNKDHAFRQKEMNVPRRGIIGDFFGVRDGEAFAASGWRNLSSFFSASKISCVTKKGSWLPVLETNSYLWAYGCGPGSFTSIEGLGNSDSYHDGVTTELYRHDPKAVFTMLYGSWLGDWDSEDNFQRAVLASPSEGLTCAWSGRPHWFMQHMAMGKPIGYSTRLTQNNRPDGLYRNEQNNCAGEIHIALMGDPTLRMHVVAPASHVAAIDNGTSVSLNWRASADDVLGYHVYRAENPAGPYTRLTPSLVKDTSFTDASAGAAGATYMVRAVKLETSGGGTYYNASEGAFSAPAVTSVASAAPAKTTETPSIAAPPSLERVAKPATPTGSATNVIRVLSPTGASATTNNTVWFDDSLPAGAVGYGDLGDFWNWVTTSPAPVSGTASHQSSLTAGFHQHYFMYATKTLAVNAGETLVTYVYIDPAHVPSEMMLQWNDGSWEHRAYWGANYLPWGTDGAASRRYMGPMPAGGQWVRLEVPASQVGLEGSTITGMAFTLYDGRASFDASGKAAVVVTNTGSSGSTTGNTSAWVDDSLPAGAAPDASGGDSWSWVTSNPTPASGQQANQSAAVSGLHQHFFTSASQTLSVGTGDVLVASAYLDPANPPSELMLQWNDGSWEHRAYWGADAIQWGSDSTASRRYMGALPPAGQWVQLQVPASAVGLEGSTLNGMAFTLYDGRVTWDEAGKISGSSTNSSSGTGTGTGTTGSGGSTNITGGVSSGNDVSWVDDALPAGAISAADSDSWNWVTTNPSPESGARSHQSSIQSGLHQHFFTSATKLLPVNTGDTLYAYVYIDPANLPTTLMLQWNDGSWEHRAYWGVDLIPYGNQGGAGHHYMGPIPAAGKWVRLEVPASAVGLEGSTINGMAFTLFGGRVTWDNAGKSTAASGSSGSTGSNGGSTTNNPSSGDSTGTSTNSTGTNGSTGTVISTTNDVSWVDDSLPSRAVASGDSDSWNWITSNPAPESGARSHQSSIQSGLHQHFFTSANSTLAVNAGDNLYAYVYIDPANQPSTLMLQWNDGSWEHRAYWGADSIPYGSNGTAGHRYMGPVPAAGQWVRLEVPASQVGLEGSTVSGMAFTLYGGRATWDNAGKSTVSSSNGNGSGNGNTGTGTGTDGSGSTTNNPSSGDSTGTSTNSTGTGTGTGTDPGTSTNSTGTGTIGDGSGTSTNSAWDDTTNSLPGLTAMDYATLNMPEVGTNALHILTPSILEVDYMNTKALDPAQVTSWNLVDGNGNLATPAASSFTVLVNGQQVAVTSVGFKRHPFYAPYWKYDLRIANSLYLQLASPVSDNQTVEVKNPGASLWPATMQFVSKADPLRYNPAIHVNQEGYMPSYTKTAMVGYYMGSLGEMPIPASSGFKIVDATTGAEVYQGTLSPRGDVGWTYSPAPYQKVYQADFSSFNTPGEYRLVVPGMGGSLPFLIDSGVSMAFARAYSLGLYHQRCGTNTSMPYTRFEHPACHTAPASIPWPAANYPFTWTTVANYGLQANSDNPVQTAPPINASSQLFPFVKQGTVDVSGGHHDAGDYSKYTANSCNLIHYLMFAADSLPGVGQLDNLGIPESGDGISDVMEEAKWEADFLAKMQDSDGGFYFLVYPVNREYEGGVTPDHGDPQVVWPKTTSVTAASVAALAQCASSPAFKKAWPDTAAMYLQKAKLGWQFLMNAINKYGKTGAYQKITHYSDEFADQDELAWAACQMFLATGDQSIHQLLLSWFDPTDYHNYRWGWWHMPVCYGHTIRSYAFAAQSGRIAASQLDPTFLAKCQQEVAAAGDSMVTAAQQSAYGTSFPSQTKAVQSAGWYFSTDQAFDIAVAYALNPKQQYMDAMLSNMNYEGGCNPVNVTYITGLGWKRQREIVSQWAPLDRDVLPPSGIPEGNIQASFFYLSTYGTEMEELVYPSDGAGTAPYPYYDRWEDGWNVSCEFTIQNSARSLGTLAMIAAQGPDKTQKWKPAAGTINVPASVVPLNQPVTVTLTPPAGVDLSGARITWEARDQEPQFGSSFTFTPVNSGDQWVEAEAQMPDGRRVFAKADFTANSPNATWVDDALPPGAQLGYDGEAWNWVNSNPAPHSGSLAHQSAIQAGTHQHYFYNATATLGVGTGDVLYAWVYLDPANMPSEIMLQWNDGSSWDHRAYWGANNITYGTDNTVSRHYMGALPAAGQWVQLKVPASAVGLEGASLSGMAFTLYNGRATWDAAGRLSTAQVAAGVSVKSTVATASRISQQSGVFTLSRTGDTSAPLTVNYSLGGSAASGVDYQINSGGGAASAVTFPAGASSADVAIQPLPATNIVGQQSVVLTLASNAGYSVTAPNSAAIALGGNTIQPKNIQISPSGPVVTWDSTSGKVYQVSYKNNLSDPSWVPVPNAIAATSSVSQWTDKTAAAQPQRFYLVAQIN